MTAWPLEDKPYAVQQLAYDLSDGHYGLDGFGLFMEQGLGKTMADFADYARGMILGKVDVMAVVCPSYLKSTWRDEHAKWKLPVPIFTWPEVPDRKAVQFVYIMNKEAVLGKGGEFLLEMLTRRRCKLTGDESSFMGNHQAQIAKRMLSLKHEARMIRLLCGTPMSNNVMNLWPQLRMLGRVNGVNPYVFRNRFAVLGGFKGKKITGVKNEPELHKILDECALRALKEDWLDLPEKIPVTRHFEMSKAQTTAYRSMLSEFFAIINGVEILADQVIHMMLKLQQITRGFVLNDGEVLEFMPPADNPAIKTVQEVIEATRGKVIVFAIHKYSVEALHQALGGVVLRGGMTEGEIRAAKAEFNDDPRCRVLTSMLSVGARGHTLLGGPGDDRCSTTIYYENNYSLDDRSQSEDRNHRIGQDKAVVYVDLIGSAMDTKIIEALQYKQSIVDAVVNAVKQTK